ncbi:hypothetical protein CC1G_10979 [Coprinopsis cinerea okayama7|uniref:Uncharacterized protein n=1 Tax=Coprinopsis cinerea (strain Okayama-7 / 130 / ATCC MYA-4618 / FGSC 9003) TaxID=240176 RepID=A8PC29_COPC7|nr:hypothetical protein CC1G_10979 [Coprinopsis cinerea okayama7\|eukprot:XP_001840316.2 hypothetical protein CC1G_10979 [Coprinopsis cinerea okayama7\
MSSHRVGAEERPRSCDSSIIEIPPPPTSTPPLPPGVSPQSNAAPASSPASKLAPATICADQNASSTPRIQIPAQSPSSSPSSAPLLDTVIPSLSLSLDLDHNTVSLAPSAEEAELPSTSHSSESPEDEGERCRLGRETRADVPDGAGRREKEQSSDPLDVPGSTLSGPHPPPPSAAALAPSAATNRSSLNSLGSTGTHESNPRPISATTITSSSSASSDSLVSLPPSSSPCSCCVDAGGNKIKKSCTCSYKSRLQRWVSEQCHFVQVDGDEDSEPDSPVLGVEDVVNPNGLVKTAPNTPPSTMSRPRPKNKWYWHSSFNSNSRDSYGQEQEDRWGDGGVRADSPVLGFEFEHNKSTKDEKRKSQRGSGLRNSFDALSHPQAPPRVQSSNPEQPMSPSQPLSRKPSLSRSPSQSISAATLPSSPNRSPYTSPYPSRRPSLAIRQPSLGQLPESEDDESGKSSGRRHFSHLTSPTTTISMFSGSSGSGSGDSTVLGHAAPVPLGRGRSQSASIVGATAASQHQQQFYSPQKPGHGHSQSVSFVNGRGYQDLQLRYQSALAAPEPENGLAPPFELQSSNVTNARTSNSSQSFSPTALGSPMTPSISRNNSHTLIAPPPSSSSSVFPTSRTPRTPPGNSQTPRTPPTLSSHPSMASLRHAVYIDSEEVRERLDALIRKESREVLNPGIQPSVGQSMDALNQGLSAPPPVRYGRSRSQSLVSVAESVDEYEGEWRSRNDIGEAMLRGSMYSGNSRGDDEDDEDKRTTLYAAGLEYAAHAMGLDKIDPVASAAASRSGSGVGLNEAGARPEGEQADYRDYLSGRFYEDAEGENEGDRTFTGVDEKGKSGEGRWDADDLDEYRDLFYKPSPRKSQSRTQFVEQEQQQPQRPPLSHSLSVPHMSQAQQPSVGGHSHSQSVSVAMLASNGPATASTSPGSSPSAAAKSKAFYQTEDGSGSRVYLGPGSPASKHRSNASVSSNGTGTNSSRSSRSYAYLPAGSATHSRASSIQARLMQGHKSQPSLSSAGSRSRTGSVSASGSVPRPAPLDLGPAMELGVEPVASLVIEAVSASVRDSVAIGPPPKRPAPAPPLLIEATGVDRGAAVEGVELEGCAEFGYLSDQEKGGEGEATLKGKVQVMSSRWSLASSSQESLELAKKEKERELRDREKKAKSAPSSPGQTKDKRKSLFGSGDAGSPDQPQVGKRSRLASFIARFAGGKDKDKEREQLNVDGEVNQVQGTWEPVPPVPPAPLNPPPLPPHLKSKLSLASLRGDDHYPGAIPPTPGSMISDWDVPPPTPAPTSSARSSRVYGSIGAHSSSSPILNRARSHSHLSVLSGASAGTFGPGVHGHGQHASPPPSPSYFQSSFGAASALSLSNDQLSPPPTPGFWAAGAGFPRSVTSSPRGSFVYPSVHVHNLPLHAQAQLEAQQSQLAPSTTPTLRPSSNDSAVAPPLESYGSPKSQNTHLSSGPATLEYSTSVSSHGYPATPGSIVEFPQVGAPLPQDKLDAKVSLDANRVVEGEGDDESLLEEAKDILDVHSYGYDSASSARMSRQSEYDDDSFDVLDAYGRGPGSVSSHARSQSQQSQQLQLRSHSRSSSVLSKGSSRQSIGSGRQLQQTLSGARSPSRSTPDVSRKSNSSDDPPPPVPPKDGLYDALTGIATQRQKMGLTHSSHSSRDGSFSGSASPASPPPRPSQQHSHSSPHVRFPALQQQSGAVSTVSGSSHSGSGRSTPSSKGMGGLMTRLRLKSSPSLGSLRPVADSRPSLHQMHSYAPLDSPPVPPPPMSRVGSPPLGSSFLPGDFTIKHKSSTKNFGSTFSRMIGRGRDKDKKGYKEEEESDLDLDEELKHLDASMAFGAGGMIGVGPGSSKTVRTRGKYGQGDDGYNLDSSLAFVGGVGGMIASGGTIKGRARKEPVSDDLDEELKNVDPSLLVGGAGGMIAVGK